ncbi:aminotransferase class V-fold PLP-dependent enzyme [Pasteurella atlantica]|uniref:Cysteine desulfurase n=2 Tax=Pasteurellaceae TaxID=712 RepID=A0ACC6HP68_9PAST|nr:cysteine desulfurase [Pasteurella atlantica]MDP8052679.1 cysteine desulfurase [Pasteurella atlantica]MDP8098631.1 cysteine desulfurase [Pasteurella atlantica]MDP8101023.1 cysteine desulfurase [Pasteurella atlantica]MDP8105951.1 cysteine desulfurase [Pasteurella atlantica]MDP8106677.1 cysteine desulfurase [Pasteurella atlantica]
MINILFRSHFPFFENQSEWTYLDSAATTLKPDVLVNATQQFYMSAGSVHRSQYDLEQSSAYEQARDLVAQRFNVEDRRAVVWTSGTTHSINLVANGLANSIQQGDEIIVSVAEHHANFVPWQQLALRTGAKLIVLSVDKSYQIKERELKQVLSSRTKIVAFNLVSNVTGVRQNAEKLIPIIRQYSNAKILLDIAQAVSSEKVDVQSLDADYYVFSAHKMYGATGVGVLMGKLQSLLEISPLMFGGKMLQTVDETHLALAEMPYCFEAGTPNIAGVIGFGAVLQWLEQWDFEELNNHLYSLAKQFRKRLDCYKNLQILAGKQIAPIISFNIKGEHHADIGSILTESKIAIRSGEHCAKPYLHYLKESGTVRVSLAHYNSQQDMEQFFKALDCALELLKNE